MPRRLFLACGLGLWLMLGLLPCALAPAGATPILALKEAENCGGCHLPGRSQRPVLERRCTLDCQGCHIDPAGAGARNQWGYYYAQDQATALTFFKPEDPLRDESWADVHYDGRMIKRDTDQESRTFPMSSEFTLRVRPLVQYLHFTYQGLYLGRIGDEDLRSARDDPRRFRERYAVMIDQIPLNLYVRAYRGQPMYGLRRPNHSLWIRERIGLDQFATTEAVEFGGTPNVPFMRYSLMQGDPYVEAAERQKGSSFHGGFRGVSYGWHINGSAWDTASETAAIKMRAIGGGLAPWKFIFMAERNWREVTIKDATGTPQPDTLASGPTRLHPSNEISELTYAFAGIPGVIIGGVEERMEDAQGLSQRRSAFVDLHPIPFVQIELWRRYETGARTLADTLGVVHLYADF